VSHDDLMAFLQSGFSRNNHCSVLLRAPFSTKMIALVSLVQVGWQSAKQPKIVKEQPVGHRSTTVVDSFIHWLSLTCLLTQSQAYLITCSLKE